MKKKILLKNLKLHDFLSHQSTEVDFHDGQKALLNGNSGSGKSSIFESIIWAIYGSGRSNNASLVRKGAKKAQVILTLVEDKNTYEIERTVTAKGKHTLSVKCNGKAHPISGLRDLQIWIEKDFIGASYLLFVNSIAYLQGGVDTFVTQTAARRKELLLEIVKTDNIEEYYDKAREMIRDLQAASDSMSRELETQKKWIADTKLKGAERPRLEEALKTIKASSSLIYKKWVTASTKVAQVNTLEARLRSVDSVLLDYQKDIESTQKEIKSSQEAQKTLDSLLGQRMAKEALEKQKDPLNVFIHSAEKQIEKREALLLQKPTNHPLGVEKDLEHKPDCPSGDKCPYMGDKVDRLKAIKNDRAAYSKWETEYNTLGEYLYGSDMSRKREELNQIVEAVHKIELLLSQKGALEVQVRQLPALESRLTEKTIALSDVAEQRKEILVDLDSEQMAKDKALANKLKGELDKFKNVEVGVLADLVFIEKLLSSMETVEEAVKNMAEEKVKMASDIQKLGLLKDAFSSKGIKAMVIDYLLPNLEEKINEILSQMSDFRVHLDTQRVGADGEKMIEGLFISVYNELGEEMDFDLYSGGEKLKIVVAISEALATLQNVGFRLFDEIFIGLDENSTESFSLVLERLQERFNQVLCISHLPEIKGMFEDQITIIKHNGISNVQK